jgi:hypothetical protein
LIGYEGIGPTLNEDELKALWKEHFARKITVNEQTIIKPFQEAHLSTGDTVFDDTVFWYSILQALSTSFEQYSPDNNVMIYLKQHSPRASVGTQIRFLSPKKKERDNSNHKSNERPPKRKTVHTNVKAGHKSSKSKRIRMTDKASPNPKRVKTSDQCWLAQTMSPTKYSYKSHSRRVEVQRFGQ